MRYIIIIIAGIFTVLSASAQSRPEKSSGENKNTSNDTIIFTTSSASDYIINLLKKDIVWKDSEDTIRLSLKRLIDHYNEPFDSVQNRLTAFDYDSVSFEEVNIIRNDTLPLRWLNDSTFIIDTLALDKDPFIRQQTFIQKIVDRMEVVEGDSVPVVKVLKDTAVIKEVRKKQTEISYDTITEVYIDTSYLDLKKIRLFQVENGQPYPPLLPSGSNRTAIFRPDSNRIILTDTLRALMANEESPFQFVPDRNLPDSLKYAVNTLLSHTSKRDSFLLYINDVQGDRTPFWLTEDEGELRRYWVKNLRNDSITLWMGNPSKHNITMILEEDINVNRMRKETVEDIPIIVLKPEKSLAKVKPLKPIPVFWNYDFTSSFAMNQTFLSNWSKGGENSLSSSFDINGVAKYVNTEDKTQWTNSARLKYANIITEEGGWRTNTDRLELNSQYNKVIKEKIDFSSIFYFKTQIARGYDYPNDSVVVSKFLNPGTFTIGAGIEYIPFKKTTINFSALSYKNTFVLDTANIDQTAHGIDKDKKAKQEIGGQLLVKNTVSLFDDLNMSNTLRLFSNYYDKPQNIDVDWEINLDKKINWYFSVMLNLHLIYDDDIRFPVMDDNDQPVKLPDGSVKKVPKTQFKQFLGLGLLFRF